MTIGTKSVLFGAHQFLIHPLFVARAWWRLYGFPWDPRLWVAFFVHDLGYIGLSNLEGPEGARHPELGARLLGIFDRFGRGGRQWHDFCLLHSRYYAKAVGRPPSRLCAADKLALALTPAWLYLPMARASGEIGEYMTHGRYRLSGNGHVREDEHRHMRSSCCREWYAGVQSYCRRWAYAHQDGAADTWTPDVRQPVGPGLADGAPTSATEGRATEARS